MSKVIGHHGCHRDFAEGLLSGRISLEQWRPSQNTYDWLGKGIYFWEGGRTRAAQWAKQQFGEQAAVIDAEIELGNCLDLLQDTHHRSIFGVFEGVRREYEEKGWSLPRNRGGRHDLDCLVLNQYMISAFQTGEPFQTIRGVFEEGEPLFPGSAIRAQAHIQIAVQDYRCIHIRS